MSRPLRICLIASSRFPIAEPFTGGLEAHTHALTRALMKRGHAVTLFAAPGSDPALHADLLDVAEYEVGSVARADVGAPPDRWMREHHAYLALMLELARTGHERFDVIHNNSLHHLPVAMASTLKVPMITTLHTPPTPWLESAAHFADPAARFVAVSDSTARQWREVVPVSTIHNGVDTEAWQAGPGGARAVWFGRIVPEKAPHLAIDAARRAGLSIDLAGAVLDTDYHRREILPRLGTDAAGVDARYVGHLGGRALARLVGASAVALVTPQWEEPYGLVAAEAMSTGTPVAAFARGGLTELVLHGGGRLSAPDDVDALARAAREALTLDRTAVRAHAVRLCSIEAMTDAYEREYEDLGSGLRAA